MKIWGLDYDSVPPDPFEIGAVGGGDPAVLEQFEAQLRDPRRIVNQTEVGGSLVSTVFLVLDHRFGSGPPLLFETMHMGTGEMVRSSTWIEAVGAHERMVGEYRMKAAPSSEEAR